MKMRSRTELVTTTLDGSDFDDDGSDLDDSGEDWKPQKKKNTRKVGNTSRKRKPAKKGRARQPPKRNRKKKVESDESEEDDKYVSDSSSSDDEPIQKLVPKAPAVTPSVLETKATENGSKVDESLEIQRPLKRKTSNVKVFPDRNGQFDLLVCKSELKDGIKDNKELCLWRRDGTSLLQKFIRDKDEDDIIFTSSSVYSCWEENKKLNYVEVKVQCHGDIQAGKVKILNADELETISETLHTDDEDVEEESDAKFENAKTLKEDSNEEDADDNDDDEVEDEAAAAEKDEDADEEEGEEEGFDPKNISENEEEEDEDEGDEDEFVDSTEKK